MKRGNGLRVLRCSLGLKTTLSIDRKQRRQVGTTFLLLCKFSVKCLLRQTQYEIIIQQEAGLNVEIKIFILDIARY